MKTVKDHFGNRMVLLKSNGYADILVFHALASSVMRMQIVEESQGEEGIMEEMLETVAKKIMSEIKPLHPDSRIYYKYIENELAAESTSPTLISLLSFLTPNLKQCSLPSIFNAFL